MPNYFSTKRYGHNIGLSAVFRQPNADHSHCSLLHGYSLAFKFTFACVELDDKNWAVDFGGLKPLKNWLAEMFDHTYLVAEDDPELETFKELEAKKLVDLRIVPATGCERFAEMVFDYADNLVNELTKGRCWVQEVTVREHGHNSATVELADTQRVVFLEPTGETQ